MAKCNCCKVSVFSKELGFSQGKELEGILGEEIEDVGKS